MASIDHSAPTNGHFGGQSYSDQSFTAAPTDFSSASQQSAQSNGGPQEIPKDEVGWYFVEQYYTTLSKNPEKLFLFYNKKSQFVSGTEAEKVMTCVGQKAINERIKELDIQDCKVRVTNVDSQGSGPNIIIQVIGEISSKGQPQKKFVQTFVLAEQTNGYFVLNDIFRYIHEEADEGQSDEHLHAVIGVHAKPSSSSAEEDAAATNEKTPEAEAGPEDNEEDSASAAPETFGDQSTAERAIRQTSTSPETAPTDTDESAPTVSTAEAATEVAAENIAKPERPDEPEPTPAASPPKQAAQPAKPPAPKTWAGLVAANRVALPAQAPNVQGATGGASASKAKTTSPPAPAAVSTSAAPAAPLSAASEAEPPTTPASSGPEWQTAQRDGHTRKQSRAQPGPVAAENSRGYIKNVNATVSEEDLKEKLDSVGKVVYFDINRQKNCAFVDFVDAAAYQAAVAANPIEVNGERFYVEERRIKAASGGFGGGPANNGRGGGFNRGRGDRPNNTPGRGGFPREGGRGGFNPRGRGSSTPRGRGGAVPQ